MASEHIKNKLILTIITENTKATEVVMSEELINLISKDTTEYIKKTLKYGIKPPFVNFLSY